jgi:hypothetical protein
MTEQPRDKAVRFIAQLVRLTKDKKIDWEAISLTDASTGTAYSTHVDDRQLRLFRYSRERPNPEYAAYINPLSITSSTTSSISSLIFRGEPPKTIWQHGVALDVIDDFGRPSYRFDNTTGLADLYEAASYSASKVDDLMDRVFKIE